MSLEEAFKTIDSICAQVPMTRTQQVQVLEALKLVRAALFPEKGEEDA